MAAAATATPVAVATSSSWGSARARELQVMLDLRLVRFSISPEKALPKLPFGLQNEALWE
jgi:hypothetical protein